MATRLTSIFVPVLMGAAIVSIPANGQAQTPPPAAIERGEAKAPVVLPAVPIAEWKMSADDLARPAARGRTRSRSAARQPASRKALSTGVKRAIVGSAAGFGGFLIGGMIGARIEGDRCNCDDPGLKGFVIGAPIGAVVGAVIGVASIK